MGKKMVQIKKEDARDSHLLFELIQINSSYAQDAEEESCASPRRIVLKKTYTFGKSADRDFQIDAEIASVDSEIYALRGAHYIRVCKRDKRHNKRDSGKKGGVFLNDHKLKPLRARKLNHGDVIHFGAMDNTKKLTFAYQRAFPNASDFEEEMKCSICISLFSDPFSVVPCGHNFCRDCVGKWLEKGDSLSCPLCKAEITVPFAVPNITLKRVIEKYSPAAGMNLKRKFSARPSLEAYITPKVLKQGILRVFHGTKCNKYPMCCK